MQENETLEAIEETPLIPSEVKSTPLPMKQVMCIMVVVISEGYAGTIIFIAFMILDFGYLDSEVGFYAGCLTSSFYLMQFLSSYFIGKWSDSKGRKPMMVLGLIGNALTLVGFGFSYNFTMALCFRCLSGLLNGNIAVMKSVCREISDQTNQARIFSLRAVAYSIGMILGPLCGGALAQPAISIPVIFSSDGLFAKFPFLLPCLFAAVVNLIGTGLCLIWFKETVVFTKKEIPNEKSNLLKVEIEIDDVEIDEVKTNKDEEIGENKIEIIEIKNKENSKPASIMQLLKQKYVALLLLILSIFSFNNMAFLELYSLWAISKIEIGGLEFNEFQLGLTHMISGVAMLFYQGFFYSALDKKMGSLFINRFVALILIPTMALFPYLINSFIGNSAFVWISISILMSLQRILFTSSYASGDIMLNNVSSSKSVGRINGLSASVASLSRTIGPIIAGSLFSWSAYSGRSWPINYSFMFSFIGVTAILCFVLTLFVSKNANQRQTNL